MTNSGVRCPKMKVSLFNMVDAQSLTELICDFNVLFLLKCLSFTPNGRDITELKAKVTDCSITHHHSHTAKNSVQTSGSSLYFSFEKEKQKRKYTNFKQSSTKQHLQLLKNKLKFYFPIIFLVIIKSYLHTIMVKYPGSDHSVLLPMFILHFM